MAGSGGQMGRCTAAVMALVVCLGTAAFGADAASQHAELRSKDEIPVTYNQGIARVRGGWILRGPCHRSRTPMSSSAPTSSTTWWCTTRRRFRPSGGHRGTSTSATSTWSATSCTRPSSSRTTRKGTQVTARYDAKTLKFRDAVELARHENSFVAVDPKTRIAYSMDNFDGDTLLRYDVAHQWKPLRPLQLSMLLEHTQERASPTVRSAISTSDAQNDMYRVNMKTGHVDRVAQITDPPGEGEGIAVAQLPSGYLHASVLDPDMTKVWVEHLSRPTVANRRPDLPRCNGGGGGNRTHVEGLADRPPP